MRELAFHDTGPLFDVVQVRAGYFCGNEITRQYHVQCGHAFSCVWRERRAGFSFKFGGDDFHCPNCGKRVNTSEDRFFISYKAIPDGVPTAITLRVVEYKQYVDLEIKSEIVKTNSNSDIFKMSTMRKMVVRADLAEQRIVLIDKDRQEAQIICVTDTPDWPLDTPLRYLNNIARINHKALCDIVMIWRKSIEEKLYTKLGYKVKSMYVAPNTREKYGMFDGQLRNISWRLSAPTAPNFDRVAWHDVCQNDLTFADATFTAKEYDVQQKTRRGMEYFTAVCDVYQLPKKQSMRTALRREGIFSQVVYYYMHKVTKNLDYLLDLGYHYCNDRIAQTIYPSKNRWLDSRVILFLKVLAANYGIAYARRVFTTDKYLSDTARMYLQLNRKNRIKLWQQKGQKKVKHLLLHDAVMMLHDQEIIANEDIPSTDRTRHMQGIIGDYEFYLPRQTHDLIAISTDLKNCVKSYAPRVVKGECIIVGVRQHKNIVACIEVQGGDVLQAKLRFNALASSDEKFSVACLTWIKRNRLKINTPDLTIDEAPAACYG